MLERLFSRSIDLTSISKSAQHLRDYLGKSVEVVNEGVPARWRLEETANSGGL